MARETVVWAVNPPAAHPSNAIIMQLAEVAHATHPDWVIDIAGRMAHHGGGAVRAV